MTNVAPGKREVEVSNVLSLTMLQSQANCRQTNKTDESVVPLDLASYHTNIINEQINNVITAHKCDKGEK